MLFPPFLWHVRGYERLFIGQRAVKSLTDARNLRFERTRRQRGAAGGNGCRCGHRKDASLIVENRK